MTYLQTTRGYHLSLRGKLVASFVSLAAVAIVGVSAPLTTLNNRQAVQGLRDKATRYAGLIAPQMVPVVAFDDQLTAREIFESFATDPDVAGLGVYNISGQPIMGVGAFPPRLIDGRPATAIPAGHIVVLAAVTSPEGRRGVLFISLTTRAAEQHARNTIATTLAIAVSALLLAFLVATRLSRSIALRVGTIASAARRVAQGSLDQPDVEPGADDDIGHLAAAFNQMVGKLRFQFVDREQRAASEQARLELLVGTRTGELQESREQYRLIAESVSAIPFTFDPAAAVFTYVGPQAQRLLGRAAEEWRAVDFLETLVTPEQMSEVRAHLQPSVPGRDCEFECAARAADERVLQLRWVLSTGESQGAACLRGLIFDITEQRRLEIEHAQSQKLESVGRLAAGVAHEINTPIQYVSDSVHFLRDTTADLIGVVGSLQRVRQAVLDEAPARDLAVAALEAEEAADLAYSFEHVPQAFARTLDGLGRVATIVRSMKEFAHPDSREMTFLDVNRAVESTLTIARCEYKYVAELETNFGALPLVRCYAGEVNQAILNIVGNAAHAIGDVVGTSGAMGRITVRTWREGSHVVVAISDTGAGIPAAVAKRIFDPFFTTKPVGKGTGQGLAIARSVVVDKHRGQLTFETAVGGGTTFLVRLPIDGPAGTAAVGAAA